MKALPGVRRKVLVARSSSQSSEASRWTLDTGQHRTGQWTVTFQVATLPLTVHTEGQNDGSASDRHEVEKR